MSSYQDFKYYKRLIDIYDDEINKYGYYLFKRNIFGEYGLYRNYYECLRCIDTCIEISNDEKLDISVRESHQKAMLTLGITAKTLKSGIDNLCIKYPKHHNQYLKESKGE